MEHLAFPLALALGFVSGFKHAFEPDHVVAVSTLLHKEEKMKNAIRMGAAWGAGHTTTLVLGVLIISLLRVQLSETALAYLELPVALMLIGLGVWAVYIAVAGHFHAHGAGLLHIHGRREHTHPHKFPIQRIGWQGYGIGLIHGLAGSGALLLLVAATLPTLLAGVSYALIFGVGSILGMGVVTLVLALPFLAARKRPLVFHVLTGLSGGLSVLLGGSILYVLWMG